MKNILRVLLAVAAVIAVASVSWASYYDEGRSGDSESDPFIIDSLSDMTELRDRVNDGTEEEGKYYRLALDLNLEQFGDWRPIGSSYEFKGHFDGNGHTIKVKFERVMFWNYGTALFGTIRAESGYAVKNLTVSGSIRDRYEAAGIAMSLYNASIENCTFTGSVESYGVLDRNVYGAAGTAMSLYNASIENCTFTGSTETSISKYRSAHTAGIVVNMFSGTIRNCTVKSSTIRAYPYYTSDATGLPGGIVAHMAGGVIEDCAVDEDSIISGVSQMDDEKRQTQGGHVSAGGIVALLDRVDGQMNRGSVRNNKCYAQVEARASSITSVNAGGIIGEIGQSNISIEDNMYNGDISISDEEQSHLGGIIGKITGSNVPTISNNKYSGALFGIGYDVGGNSTDNPGCIKMDSGNNPEDNPTSNPDEDNPTTPNQPSTPNIPTDEDSPATPNQPSTPNTPTNEDNSTTPNTDGNETNTTPNTPDTTATPGENTPIKGGGGGGGCNSGLGLLGLLLAATALRKR